MHTDDVLTAATAAVIDAVGRVALSMTIGESDTMVVDS